VPRTLLAVGEISDVNQKVLENQGLAIWLVAASFCAFLAACPVVVWGARAVWNYVTASADEVKTRHFRFMDKTAETQEKIVEGLMVKKQHDGERFDQVMDGIHGLHEKVDKVHDIVSRKAP
jgi:hypothetical protein